MASGVKVFGLLNVLSHRVTDRIFLMGLGHPGARDLFPRRHPRKTMVTISVPRERQYMGKEECTRGKGGRANEARKIHSPQLAGVANT